MKINRREFLKISAGTAAGVMAIGLGMDLKPVKAYAQTLKIRYAKESTTICPYCAVGCGIIVHTSKGAGGKVINAEGDPDHPINEGALCSKGAALSQLVNNENRLTTPLYRKPYSHAWQKVSWDWALYKIALNIKKTRDATFIRKNSKGQVINRTEAIASCGSAALDNEECWPLQAMMRALGLVYIEHQARI
jgi:formate dehydrogenase major subunit